MIVKNEEEVLARCLDSIQSVADEIVIVDTGSTDRTKQIAAAYTTKVYDFEWTDDFSAARNFAFSKATGEYIMWLDADDVVMAEDAQKIADIKSNGQADVFFLKYHVAFERDGTPVFSYYRERILRNCPQAVWRDPVHEAIVPFGVTAYSQAAVCHKKVHAAQSGRNLRIYSRYLEKGGVLSPRMQYYYARELMYNEKEREACEIYAKFLREKKGLTDNLIGACRDLYRCYKKLGEKRPEILTYSFIFGLPRAEILCEIGLHYFEEQDWEQAKFWYLLAAKTPAIENGFGFVEKDYYGYIPYMQLCVICDRTGRRHEAKAYNDLAGALKPDSEGYLFNKKYFEQVLED